MKDQLQRVLTLDRWLRARRRIVAKDAAAELGVVVRTNRRDLKEVRAGQWRLPVRYDRPIGEEHTWSATQKTSRNSRGTAQQSERCFIILKELLED